MPSWQFSSYDIQNSAVTPYGAAGEKVGTAKRYGFSTNTQRSRVDGLTRMTLYKTSPPGRSKTGEPRTTLGRIVFKDKKIIVGNVTKTFDEVKQSTRGSLSMASQWQWDSSGKKKKYSIKYENKTWLATPVGETDAVATYDPFKPSGSMGGKYTLAKITFPDGMSERDQTWLFLALIFVDLELKPVSRPSSFIETVVEGVDCTTNVAITATDADSGCDVDCGCCVIA